jgi:signal transduction histidine kinase
MIFERYYRSDESPTQPGSVGIGLSVSRQLAELMGGTLTYVSASGDSRFEFIIPAIAPIELDEASLGVPAVSA